MWTRGAAIAIVCAMISARSLAALGAPDAPVEAMWLAVTLNGQKSEVVALFLRRQDGHVLAGSRQLRLWRLQAPPEMAVSYEGEAYIPLDALTGLSYTIDEERQSVAIDAPSRLFDQVTLDGTAASYAPIPPSPWGGFLNYDFVAANVSGRTSLSGLIEASLFGPLGAGVVRYLERHEAQQTQSIRLDSTWTTDRPQAAVSFRLGDSITGASASWGSAVRFGGIQWSSNFATRPGLITMPLPSVAGEAAVPSTLEVYVNDSLRLRNDVQGGPFRVNDVPIVTGEGEIRLVVHDLLGRERVITESYYASPALLRPGLHDYSFEAGVARENYGITSNDYGRPLMVVTDRVGLTNHLTGEVHGELLRDQQTLGFSGALLLSSFGILSASAAASHAKQGNGQLLNLGFERAARWLSLGANAEYASPAFTRLGILPGAAIPRLKSQMFMTAGLGRLGSLSVSRTRQEYRDRRALEILSARDSIDIGGLGYLTLSVARTVDGTRDTILALSLTHSLNARTILSATATSDAGGTGAELDLQQSLPAGRGLGYRVVADAGPTRAVDATLDMQGDVGAYQIEARHQSGATLAQASATGGLAILADHVFPSRRIDDSFAVAEVGEERDVRMYRENQLVGQTDAKGYLLVPGLRAYQNNTIRVEQADLPLDITIDAMQVQAVPNFRSGVLLQFPVQRPRGALLSVRLESGEPLPTGVLVQVTGQEEEFPSGLHGEVYVTGLAATNRLRANWAGKTCEFTVPYSQTSDPLPRLGPYVCKSVAP